MLLAVSIDNAHIYFGVYQDNKLITTFNISADLSKTADEYAVILNGIFEMHGIKTNFLEAAILSSVVPPLSAVIDEAISNIVKTKPIFVGPGIKTGLNIKIDNPAQLGTDLVAMTVGAIQKYAPPMIIISLGIATTISVVSEACAFLGTLIIPGLRSSLDSLSSSAANLPDISIDLPKTLIGKNTVDSMKSGVIYGACAMIDGLIDGIIRDQGFTCPATIIATGDFTDLVVPNCTHHLHTDQTLLMDGLCHLYNKNTHCTLKKGQ